MNCWLQSSRWVGGLYVDADPVRRDGDYVGTGGGILLKWADIASLGFRQIRGLGTENGDGEKAPLQA